MLRSLLFVPAKEKMLNKIASFTADGYIIDLEDSISEEEKGNALNSVISFLNEQHDIPNLYVRLNKNRFEEEAIALNHFKVGFMLPKFEIIDEYSELISVWNLHKVIALIETPMGVLNAHETAKCVWIDALSFGAEDYTANVNMLNDDVMLRPVKSILVMTAKAYNKKVFDTPSFKLTEENEFEQEVKNAVGIGFDGKMAISPKHIQFINDAFNSSDLDYMKSAISRYEADGNAVVVIDGKVYEKMHINRFKKIIKENSKNLKI